MFLNKIYDSTIRKIDRLMFEKFYELDLNLKRFNPISYYIKEDLKYFKYVKERNKFFVL